MLSVFRTLSFLSPPLAFVAVAVMLPELEVLPAESRRAFLVGAALTLAAGAGGMAAVAWIAGSRRLNGVARALDAVRDGEAWNGIPERGAAADRRVARALNALAAALEDVESRASRDRLTGTANRERILGALMIAVERSGHSGRPLSVGFVDIDRFKAINDAYGHASGDAVLRQVSELVSATVRGGDLVGRYGGEEFMLILPDTDAARARVVAERVRTVVMRTPLTIAGNHRLNVTVSIGIAVGAGSDLRLEALVAEADAAMYVAKSRGRNQTQVFPELQADTPAVATDSSVQRHESATAIGQWAGMNLIQALASLLAPPSEQGGRPSDQIAAMATSLAARVGVSAAEIEQIRIASLLHDVGKLAIPREILDKRQPLTDTEWQAITEHTRIGELVLEQATALRDAIPIVLHHHERFNGSGYPDGLEAAAIPMGARIVAIADAYHAMVHDRPYHRAMPHEEALAELRRMAGVQFDPELVAAFCDLHRDGISSGGPGEVSHLHEPERRDLRELRSHHDRLPSDAPGEHGGAPAARAS